MKKTICFIIALITSIMLLTSCTPPQTEPEVETNFQPVGNFNFSMYDKAVDGRKLEDAFYMQPVQKDTSTLLQKIDYTTQTKTVLCNIPNCMHTDENCVAWFSGDLENSSGSSAVVLNGETYVVFFGNREATTSEGFARIEKFNEELTSREKLYEFESKEILTGSFIQSLRAVLVTDDENIYFVKDSLQTPDEETGAPVRTVCAYNTKQNKVFTLKNIPPTQELVGAFDNTLVFRKDSDDVIYIEVPAEELESTVILYDVKNNTETKLFTYPYINRSIVSDGKYYTLSSEWDISVCNLRTQTESAVLFKNVFDGEELDFEYIPNKNKTSSFYSLGGIYDNKMIIEIELYEGESVERIIFAVNLETGEFTKLANLTYYIESYNMSYPQDIAAESEDYFLIIKSTDIFQLKYSYSDSIFEVDAVSWEYAFIRKEDFWNNKPNYIDIK